jgi:CubicO group peptidase (beta-lactamase class C family)
MRKILFSCLFLISVSDVAISQVVKRSVLTRAGSPEEAGFSSERLKRVDNLIKGFVDRGATNGAVAMIVRNGKIVYFKAFGYDADPSTPLKTDAIFRIASQTKAITSVAVMMLYEEGKFLLDDPISDYIPEFKKPKVLDKYNAADTTYTTVPAKREITIRDLLTHTSGIGYAQIGSPESNAIYYKAGIVGGIGVKNIVLGDKMKILGSMPLLHQPGEKWTYGLNTDLLGYLVEVLSGMSLDEFFRKRIFQPLGMKDSYFYLPKEKYNRLTTLYTEDTATGKAKKMAETININGEMIRDFPNTAGTYFSGGGGLSSTVYDYAIFLQMMLNGGEYNGQRLLSPHTIRMMTMNQVGDLNLGNNKFGLGFGITTEKGSSIIPTPAGVFDWGGMFSTTYWADPKEKLIGLIYRNIWPTRHWQLSQKFKVMVYQALVEKQN